MAEPKPCPFCGANLWWNDNEEDLYVRRYGPRYVHPDGVDATCYLRGEEVRPEEVDAWNCRVTDGVTASVVPQPLPIKELLAIYDEQKGDWCAIVREVERRHGIGTSGVGASPKEGQK